MASETLDPVAIEQLTWLTAKQAQVYLSMSSPKFADFVHRQNIPFQSDDHTQATAKRRYYKANLDKGMLAETHERCAGALSGAEAARVSTIAGGRR